MGVTKTEYFTEKQNRTAGLLKALAHPARVAVLEQLLNAKSCVCGDFVNKLPLAQPTISQHLKELKQVGIIQGTVEGNSVCYCLNPQTINDLYEFLKHIVETLKNQNTHCC